jgi:hypothetical protein
MKKHPKDEPQMKKFRSTHQTVSNLPPLEDIAQQAIEKRPTEAIIPDPEPETVPTTTEQNKQREIYLTSCMAKKRLGQLLGFDLHGYKK